MRRFGIVSGGRGRKGGMRSGRGLPALAPLQHQSVAPILCCLASHAWGEGGDCIPAVYDTQGG